MAHVFLQSGVWNFKVGDRVWGATDPFKGGCQVEYTAVNEVHSGAISCLIPYHHNRTIYPKRRQLFQMLRLQRFLMSA